MALSQALFFVCETSWNVQRTDPAKLPRGSLLDVLALGPTSLVYTRDKSEAQNAVKKRRALSWLSQGV